MRSIALAGGVLCLPPLAMAGAAAAPQAKPEAPVAGAPAIRTIDLVIVNGRVIDGTGTPPRSAEVGIDGDRIVFVGPRPAGMEARRTIDAGGLLVAPGFIDPHTHSASDALSADPDRRRLGNHLLQGVTTVVIGNDGGGDPDVKATFARLGEGGTGTNVASFVGFGAVRKEVVGDADRPPSPDEQQRMEMLVERAMCEGALGLSAGLYYAPQSFARTQEVVQLARAAALHGGIYETHLRDEGSSGVGLLPAIDEALAIAREAGTPLHISHIKALGVDAQGMAPQVVAKVADAQRSGLRVTADQYPWTASSTRMASALVPRWAMDGGRDAMVRRLRDADERLRTDMAEQLRIRGGAGSVLLVDGTHRGSRLSEIAGRWNLAPVEAAIRLLIAEPGAGIASFNMSDADIETFARQPWVLASSDATKGHPRAYGSFARRWRLFVRERPVISDFAFVHRASALTAGILGLPDRGTLAPSRPADLVVLDPAAYRENATYEAPETHAAGVVHVFVNGVHAVKKGVLTGALAGRPLAKPRQPEWNCPA